MMPGYYSRQQAVNIVTRQIQSGEGWAKAYWNRQNALIKDMENQLVAVPMDDYGLANPTAKFKWILGETVVHHCKDCLRLSKLPAQTKAEWEAMKTGLPRHGHTACKWGCQCMLKAVGAKAAALKVEAPKIKVPDPVKEVQARLGLSDKAFQELTEHKMAAIITETGNKYETCYALDKSGNILIHKAGQKSSISFDAAESKQITDAKIFLHNHPRNSSFSPDDILTSLKLNMTEIRAITPESYYGNGYYYIKPAIPAGMDKTAFINGLSKKIKNESNWLLDKNYDKIMAGTLDRNTAEKTHMDTIWKIIAKKYGWEYGFKTRI
jgi:hypothetical protein